MHFALIFLLLPTNNCWCVTLGPRWETLQPNSPAYKLTPLEKTVIIKAVFPEQELDLTTRYWEGAVDIFDKQDPRQPIGSGYMEMTGYADGSS